MFFFYSKIKNKRRLEAFIRTNIVFLLRHSNKEVTKHEYFKIKKIFIEPDV